MRKILFAICAMAVLCAIATTASAQLFFSQDNNENGLFSINTTTGEASLVAPGSTGVTSNTVGLAPGDQPGTLIGSIFAAMHRIEQDGSGFTLIGDAIAEGLAYDPGSDTLWAGINGSFGSVSTGDFTTLTPLADPIGFADLEGLAYDRTRNVVYGLAGFAGPMGELQEYDVANDSWRIIGDTSIDFDLPGLAYDSTADVLYAVGSQDDNLYRIDPTDASTVLIGPTGLQDMGTLTSGGGLAFVPEPATGTLALLCLGGLLLRRRAA